MTSLSDGVFGTTKLATFDARVFVVPEADVCNYFIWRQQDWTRNSLQMLTRAHYSHGDCNGWNQAKMHDKLHEKGINWDALPVHLKRGRCVRRRTQSPTEPLGTQPWTVDIEPPIFSRERDYIEALLAIDLEDPPTLSPTT